MPEPARVPWLVRGDVAGFFDPALDDLGQLLPLSSWVADPGEGRGP